MLALGVLAVSCTVGTPETGYNEDGTLAKIVNAPLCCDSVDGILVKFKDFAWMVLTRIKYAEPGRKSLAASSLKTEGRAFTGWKGGIT